MCPRREIRFIRVGGSGPRNTRKLNHFAAPLALERAAIPLASDRFSQLEAQNGVPSKDRALQFATLPFSQRTFHETECLFRINKLPLRHAWIGTPAPSTDPPQAEGIVHIGATKEVAFPVQLSLSRASLMVRRPADLLALTYRFQDARRAISSWCSRRSTTETSNHRDTKSTLPHAHVLDEDVAATVELVAKSRSCGSRTTVRNAVSTRQCHPLKATF